MNPLLNPVISAKREVALRDYSRRKAAAFRKAMIDDMKRAETNREKTMRRQRQAKVNKVQAQKAEESEQMRFEFEDKERRRQLQRRKAIDFKISPAKEQAKKKQARNERVAHNRARKEVQDARAMAEEAELNDMRREEAALRAKELKITPTKIQATRREVQTEYNRRRKEMLAVEEELNRVNKHVAAEFYRQSVQARLKMDQTLRKEDALLHDREERELRNAMKLSLQDQEEREAFLHWQSQKEMLRKQRQGKVMQEERKVPLMGLTPSPHKDVSSPEADRRLADALQRVDRWTENMKVKELVDSIEALERKEKAALQRNKLVVIHHRRAKLSYLMQKQKEEEWLQAEHHRAAAVMRADQERYIVQPHFAKLRRQMLADIRACRKFTLEAEEEERIHQLNVAKQERENKVNHLEQVREAEVQRRKIESLKKSKPLKRQLDFIEVQDIEPLPDIPKDF